LLKCTVIDLAPQKPTERQKRIVFVCTYTF
jgi:hypothetical protein